MEFVNDIRSKSKKLKEYIVGTKNDSSIGLLIWGSDALKKEYRINKEEISKEEYDNKKEEFYKKYISVDQDKVYKNPLIKPSNIRPFRIIKIKKYLNTIENFDRPRNKTIYFGKKILLPRVTNKIRAVFSSEIVYFNTDVFTIKLKDENNYDLFTAILNSDFIDFILSILFRKRANSGFPKINVTDLFEIPIPSRLNSKIVNKINILSKALTDGTYAFEEKKGELNNLISDLYELDALQRQRILDFYDSKNDIIKFDDIISYCETFSNVFKIHLKENIELSYEYYSNQNLPLYIAGVRVIFNTENNTSAKDIIKHTVFNISYDLLKNIGAGNFLYLKERIYDKNSIFILKDNCQSSWTKTQAYDDAINELKQLRKNLDR